MDCATRSTHITRATHGIKMRKRWLLIAGAAVIILALIAVVIVHYSQTPSAPVALPLTQTFSDSTSVTFKYPDDWNYTIPDTGLLIIGPNQTLDGEEAGPTLTIQRAEPLEVAGTLDDALNRYLTNGPLHNKGRWQIT